jgi:hypothetical protein
MSTTRIAVASFVAAAAIAGPTASALAGHPQDIDQSWRGYVAKVAKAERSPQVRSKTAHARTWQEELVRHRFH